MPKELLEQIDLILKEKVSEIKEERKLEDNLAWTALMNEQLIEGITLAVSDAISKLVIKSPDVNVPEIPPIDMKGIEEAIKGIKISVPKIPEIKVEIPPIEVPKANIKVTVPEVKIPTINVPAPQVTVNAPEITEVGLIGIDRKSPLPVISVGLDGNPLPQVTSGGGGGRSSQPKERVQSPKTDDVVTVGTVSTEILPINIERHTFTLVNDSDEVIYLKYGGTAVLNSGLRLNAGGGSHTDDVYSGQITAICVSGGKKVTVLEL